MFIQQRWGVLEALVVDSSWRRRGVGARLTRAVEAWALGLGAAWVELNVYAFNAEARKFYEGLGYLPLSTKLRKLRELANQPQPECLKLTPFELIEVDGDARIVKVQFAPQPAFGNHFGHIQGGFAAAMLDVPISAAVFVKVQQWLPTLELKCSFLRPARIGACVAEGRVLRAGRQIVFVEGRLWGGDGELAVHATATVSGASR